MLKPLNPNLEAISEHRKTGSALLTQSSQPSSMPSLNREAARAVRSLLNFYPPLDVVDAEAFISGVIAIFAQYPGEVIAQAIDPARGIPKRLKYLRLADITEVLDELNVPYQRETERILAEHSHRLGLPPPREKRTPEQQARIDAQVEEARRMLPPAKPRGWFPPMKTGDGKHALRVANELAARKARTQERQEP